MKKNIIKQIEAAAILLPVKLTQRPHTEYFGGDEANKAQEQYNEGKRIKFDPNKSYPSTTPITEEVNHVAKMKSAYKAGGWQAVEKYISQNKSV